ncbi:MAG: exosortase C-terminal domain/associated protein EpsI [Terriglobales bacterium]
MPVTVRRHWLLLAVLLLATFGVRARLGASPSVPLRQPLERFPAQLGPWSLIGQPAMTPDELAVLKADDYMLRDYAIPAGATPQGQQAQLFVAYYRNQRAGESMHSPKNCLPGSGWAPILSDEIALPAAPAGTRINRYVVENQGDRELVLYWYQAQGRIIASEYWGKFYLIWDAMRQGRRDGAIVRVVVPMSAGEGVDAATQEALDLADRSLPRLSQYLPQ